MDLFPHTPHCELVVLLERVTEKKLSEVEGREDNKTDVSVNPQE